MKIQGKNEGIYWHGTCIVRLLLIIILIKALTKGRKVMGIKVAKDCLRQILCHGLFESLGNAIFSA